MCVKIDLSAKAVQMCGNKKYEIQRVVPEGIILNEIKRRGIMKSNKKFLALLMLISMLLTACENMGMSATNDTAHSVSPIQLSELTVSTSKEENNATNELQPGKLQTNAENVQSEEVSTESTLQAGVETVLHADIATLDVSRKEAVVNLEEENFIKRAFAVGGDMIYLAGKSADGSDFWANLTAEDKTLNYFTVEMPGNMQVLNMTVDAQGNCHMFWVSAERQVIDGVEHNIINFEKCCITKMNRDGELEAIMDISELFADLQTRPYCFITDADGCYYFETGEEIVKVYPDGSQAALITCDGRIEVIGCAQSGEIYCVYQAENGEEYIGWVEGDKVTNCGTVMPEVNASYSVMTAGTDTEILLFNKEGGVFAYDAVTNTLDIRVAGTELPVAGQDISGCGFLGDGRLCLMEQIEDTTTFYYIPAGE